MQNSSTQDEVKRLLELQKIPEHQRTQKQQLEVKKLQERHETYALKLKNKAGVLTFAGPMSAAANSISILQSYANKFANTPGYQKPSPNQGIKTLTFSNGEDAARFLQSQAAKGRKFRVLDPQHRVIAISNGKGLLQHADGRPFNAGSAFAALANTNIGMNLNSTNNINTMLNKNQALQQRIFPRPNMTIPPSTPAMNPQVVRPKVKPPVSPVNVVPVSKPKVQTPPLEVQNKTFRTPTPFKKSPYEQ